MKRIYKIMLPVFFSGIVLSSVAQTTNILTLESFMNQVKEKNIHYLVEKYSVDIAKANADAAKVFPDPNLSLGGTDNQDHQLKMGYSLDAGLDYNLELGNKRKARIRLAESEAELTTALLKDYFRNLRADAMIAYYNALKQRELLEVQKQSYDYMAKLALGDSIRYRLGSIMEIDAKQSKLEANTMFNDVIESEMEFHNSLIELSMLQGDNQIHIVDSISGQLNYSKHNVDLFTLITNAQDNRADLQATLKSKEVSQRNLQLAKANRAIDLGLNLGVSRSAIVRNEIAPAPAYTAVSAGISIPLKFSNGNKGGIRSGQLAVQQSETNYKAVEQQVQSEVIQAYNLYVATCRQVEQFKTGLLGDAESIVVNKIYSYERGQTSLLEVLNARRTYNDVHKSYYETLYNNMVALIELERVSASYFSVLPSFSSP